MPSSYLEPNADVEPYNVSMFFWYFEARQNPRNAQTAIYLAGGPGQSSMFGATQSGGPCTILPDSNSTADNPWAWNRYVNMLYVDQPIGAGFSYDLLVNITYDLVNDKAALYNAYGAVGAQAPPANTTFLYGTVSNPDPFTANTAYTAGTAARYLWSFAQAWFTEFEGYNAQDKRVSFWGNSYGGVFVPYSAAYFEEQNVRIRNGEVIATILPIDTVGWTNGCTDMLYQADFYADMANNNTYGVKAVDDEVFQFMKMAWNMPGGCKESMTACRDAGDTLDSEYTGLDETVNELCYNASATCEPLVSFLSEISGRSEYDIANAAANPWPTNYHIGFLNQKWVQRELGVPVNFTANSATVVSLFIGATGDFFRAAGLKKVNYLLQSGVKVAMVYGDRDFRCNWIGGEQLSLNAQWRGAERFKSSGYENIKADDCGTNGGVVRQYGNLSFSRVYEAGHDVAFYQPRTAFEIFTRSMLNLDIATGNKTTIGDFNNYSSVGPNDSWHIKNELPGPAVVECNIWAAQASCTPAQLAALQNGTAIVKDFIVISPMGDITIATAAT